LKALARRPGISALAMVLTASGNEAKSLPVPSGIGILNVDRRAVRDC
jgi:hypothetical protein